MKKYILGTVIAFVIISASGLSYWKYYQNQHKYDNNLNVLRLYDDKGLNYIVKLKADVGFILTHDYSIDKPVLILYNNINHTKIIADDVTRMIKFANDLPPNCSVDKISQCVSDFDAGVDKNIKKIVLDAIFSNGRTMIGPGHIFFCSCECRFEIL